MAVTGAAGALGALVVDRLVATPGVRRVIGVDIAVGAEQEGVEWRLADVRDPLLDRALDGAQTVVHLAGCHHPDMPADERHAVNVRGTAITLAAASTVGASRVVCVTSAMVYGALADNPVPLPESAPLRAARDESLVGDFVAIERLIEQQRVADPRMELTVLRPAALVGPGADSVVTRHFESPRLLVVRGTTPRWQFCHIDDLAAACVLAATGHVRGSANVAPEGWLDQTEVEALTGLRRFEVPASLAFATAERLHRAGLTPAPSSELHYLTQSWVVDAEALRDAGWKPAYDNAGALRAHVELGGAHVAVAGRRLGRQDATRAAAGATVALLGTAALVRRARKRRR